MVFHDHPAHPSPRRRHNQPVILHVTVSVYRRDPLLANSCVQEALEDAWTQAAHWKVGYYMIMPDHVHLFCAPGVDTPLTVRKWAGYWKRLSGELESVLKHRFRHDCWDTQIYVARHYSPVPSLHLAIPISRRNAVLSTKVGSAPQKAYGGGAASRITPTKVIYL